MADEQKSGQDQNLKDVLGFDPTEDPNKFSSQVPQPTDERTGFPDNWQELFSSSIEREARMSEMQGGGVIIKDPDNLFSVIDYIRYHGDYNGIFRAYYRYSQEWHRFETSSYVFLPYTPDRKQRFVLLTKSDNNEVSSIEFNDPAPSGDDPIEIEKTGIGGREFVVGYDKDGNVSQVNFHIRYTRDDIDAEGLPDVYMDEYSLGEYRYEGRWYSGGDKNDIGKLEMKEDRKTGRITLRRIEDGEVKDEMEFPRRIDPQALKGKWLRDALLRDPKNPDIRLDENWRGVDFFHDAGLRWDAVADDRLHSLNKIPEPAAEA